MYDTVKIIDEGRFKNKIGIIVSSPSWTERYIIDLIGYGIVMSYKENIQLYELSPLEKIIYKEDIDKACQDW